MKRSRNEIEGMALKAARGAGLPLGHAEDFARAVGVFSVLESAAFDKLANALDGPFDVDVAGPELALAGPVVMIAPLAFDALRSGEDRVVVAPSDDAQLLRAYMHIAAQDFDMDIKNADGVLTMTRPSNPPKLNYAPVEVPEALWQVWADLAARTYVPETEKSRLAGAGAGLTDND